jgi:hypothetical protein
VVAFSYPWWLSAKKNLHAMKRWKASITHLGIDVCVVKRWKASITHLGIDVCVVKRWKRGAVQPRVEDAKRPKPWVNIAILARPAWPMQGFCAAPSELYLFAHS